MTIKEEEVRTIEGVLDLIKMIQKFIQQSSGASNEYG